MTLREKLPGLAKRGLTQAEAARELGVSRQRVSQITAELRLAFRPRYPALPNAKARLRKLAKRGLTRTEAARELGVSLERVTNLAAEYGVTFVSWLTKPKEPTTKLGRVLQGARLAARYSYAKLAVLSGLHSKHVAAIEQGGVRRPTERTLRALANSLQGHASYDTLVSAAYGREASPPRARRRRRRPAGRLN